MSFSKRTYAIVTAVILCGTFLTFLGFYWRQQDIQEINDLDYNIHSHLLMQIKNYNLNSVYSEIKNRFDKRLFYTTDEYSIGSAIPTYVIIGQSATTWLFSMNIHKLTIVDSTYYYKDNTQPRQMNVYAGSIPSRSTTFISFIFFFAMAIVILSFDKRLLPSIYCREHSNEIQYECNLKYILITIVISSLVLILLFVISFDIGEIDFSHIQAAAITK